MSDKPYLIGQWAIFENRGSTQPLGYIVDGVGVPAAFDQPPFQIEDEVLIAPDGARLGHLIPLGESWAVGLGSGVVGHVLRLARTNSSSQY